MAPNDVNFQTLFNNLKFGMVGNEPILHLAKALNDLTNSEAIKSAEDLKSLYNEYQSKVAGKSGKTRENAIQEIAKKYVKDNDDAIRAVSDAMEKFRASSGTKAKSGPKAKAPNPGSKSKVNLGNLQDDAAESVSSAAGIPKTGKRKKKKYDPIKDVKNFNLGPDSAWESKWEDKKFQSYAKTYDDASAEYLSYKKNKLVTNLHNEEMVNFINGLSGDEMNAFQQIRQQINDEGGSALPYDQVIKLAVKKFKLQKKQAQQQAKQTAANTPKLPKTPKQPKPPSQKQIDAQYRAVQAAHASATKEFATLNWNKILAQTTQDERNNTMQGWTANEMVFYSSHLSNLQALNKKHGGAVDDEKLKAKAFADAKKQIESRRRDANKSRRQQAQIDKAHDAALRDQKRMDEGSFKTENLRLNLIDRISNLDASGKQHFHDQQQQLQAYVKQQGTNIDPLLIRKYAVDRAEKIRNREIRNDAKQQRVNNQNATKVKRAQKDAANEVKLELQDEDRAKIVASFDQLHKKIFDEELKKIQGLNHKHGANMHDRDMENMALSRSSKLYKQALADEEKLKGKESFLERILNKFGFSSDKGKNGKNKEKSTSSQSGVSKTVSDLFGGHWGVDSLLKVGGMGGGILKKLIGPLFTRLMMPALRIAGGALITGLSSPAVLTAIGLAITGGIAYGLWKNPEVAKKLWQGTKDVASNMWEGTKNIASSAWQGTKDIASGAMESASNIDLSILPKAKASTYDPTKITIGPIKADPEFPVEKRTGYAKASKISKNKVEEIHQMLIDEAKRQGVDPNIVLAIAEQESSFNPNARNKNSNGTYDYGVMQINEKNFKALGLDMNSVFDPKKNIAAGVRLLREELSYFKKRGDKDYIKKAILAYNAGRPSVASGKNTNEHIYGDEVFKRLNRIQRENLKTTGAIKPQDMEGETMYNAQMEYNSWNVQRGGSNGATQVTPVIATNTQNNMTNVIASPSPRANDDTFNWVMRRNFVVA